jgi:hypothetical protein
VPAGRALNFFLGTYTESLVDRYGREAAMAYIETTLAQALDDNA